MNSEDRGLVGAVTQERWTQDCEGWSRRSVLKVGLTALLGLTLPDLLQLRALASPAQQPNRKPACILLFMAGGPSHLDTFDPKPMAGLDFTGPFKARPTNVDGIQICEHLPLLAKQADRYSLIRSMHSGENSHERGQHYLQTGYLPLPVMQYPSVGAIVSRERASKSPLPPYVLLNQPIEGQGAGYLGDEFAPFLGRDPSRADYHLPDGQPGVDVDYERITRRRALLTAIDTLSRDQERVRQMDGYYARAVGLMESKEAREAFEISKEPAPLRDRYGRGVFGQSCLLARRLVERGVPFVTVTLSGWDTHQNNFDQLRSTMLPTLDQGLSALLDDLKQRGMAESTLVVLTGEFGRTPRVNANTQPGRDHWADAWTVLMAGGGLAGGRVIGATDERGEKVIKDPVTPENLSATVLSALGIDHRKTYETPAGRPIRLSQGNPIAGLT